MRDQNNRGPAARRNGTAGGSLLALSVVAGAVIGTFYGQPSLGFLAGMGVGIALLLLVWLVNRSR